MVEMMTKKDGRDDGTREEFEHILQCFWYEYALESPRRGREKFVRTFCTCLMTCVYVKYQERMEKRDLNGSYTLFRDGSFDKSDKRRKRR